MDSKAAYFEYLDDLRESGIVNMFWAGEFLEDAFGLGQQEAQRILIEWMKSKENDK